MIKSITIGRKPSRLWEAEEQAAERRPTKRLTFDIDAELHLRIRLDCTRRGVNMSDEIRRMLAERWATEPITPPRGDSAGS